MIRRRHLLYVLAALAVPLPVSAAVSGGGAAASLSVGVSLNSCGVASSTVVCKLDASFNPVDGARYYTAAVTGPDGSVVDYGNVPSGSASLWVPYVGNGTYTVTVSAWGRATNDYRPKPLATDTATAGDGNGAVHATSTPGASPQGGSGAKSSADTAAVSSAGHVGTPGTGSAGSGSSSSASPDGSNADPGTYSPDTTCVPIPATPPPPSDPAASGPTGATGSSGIDGVSSGDAQAMQSQGVLPTDSSAADCPDPQTTPDGSSCCPTPAG